MTEVWGMSEMMNKENLFLEDNMVLQMLETLELCFAMVQLTLKTRIDLKS